MDSIATALSQAGLKQAPDAGFWTDGTALFVEVKSRLPAVRGLRAAILQLASYLTRHPDYRGVLVLLEPAITRPRVASVWEEARAALNPDIRSRLDVIVVDRETIRDQREGIPPALSSALSQVTVPTLTESEKLPRPDYFIEILKLLLRRRFLREGPVTTDWLSKAAGCSYPTTRRALDRLAGSVVRQSDRKVELGQFPRGAWAELVAGSERLRGAVRFGDRSGQPRSPESLLRRLDRTGQHDIAVGGVIGAALTYSDLDLLGAPRLDLCLHAPGNRLNLDVIVELDPALVRLSDPRDPARVVVHPVRRREPFFEPREGGVARADPVECLLDLYEAWLGPQADAFLAWLEEGGAA